MNDEPRAQRGLRRGPESVSLVGDTSDYSVQAQALQASKIKRQFGLGAELATVIAAMAYGPKDETWRSAR